MWREKLILKDENAKCKFHSRCRQDLGVGEEAACFYECFPEFMHHCVRLEKYEKCEEREDG